MEFEQRYPSITMLKAALAPLGYTHQELLLDGASFSRFTAPNGNNWLTASGKIQYPFGYMTARSVSTDKQRGYELATHIGVSVPKTWVLQPPYPINSKAALQHAPLVVKPATASLSNGVSLGIKTAAALTKAINKASQQSEKVLVQQQVSGEEIRFIVINQRLTAALLRQTPRVVGDGTSTLQQLIDQENNHRKELVFKFISYPQLDTSIVDFKKLHLSDIPAKGSVVEFGNSTMVRGGASIYNVLDRIHPSYIETVQQLAKPMGNGLLAVDMMIQDYTQPMTKDNYHFIEYNLAPVLKLCYACRDGQHYDILADIVPRIDQAIQGANS